MLFQNEFHDPIRRGELTLAVRRWERPQVQEGGIYRLPTGGAIEVTAFDRIEVGEVTQGVAQVAGYASPELLLREIEQAGDGEGDLYIIGFRYVGDVPDPDAAFAAAAALDQDALADLVGRLRAMDRGHAWTQDALQLIGNHEGMRAAELARRMGRKTERFKTDVRRLKSLGLTENLEAGYRLTRRGHAFLGAVEAGEIAVIDAMAGGPTAGDPASGDPTPADATTGNTTVSDTPGTSA